MKINEETIRKAFPSIEGYISSLNENNYSWVRWVWAVGNIREAFDICGLDKSVSYGTLLRCENIRCISEDDRKLHGRLKQLNNLLANVCMLNEIRKFLIQEYIWEDSNSYAHISALHKAARAASPHAYNTYCTIDAAGYYVPQKRGYHHFLEDHTIAEKDKVVFRKIKNYDAECNYTVNILLVAEEEKDLLLEAW